MNIDELTRESFLAPLIAIQDIPPFDKDGNFQLEDGDFWNLYNPDKLDVPHDKKAQIKEDRAMVKEAGKQFRKDAESFLATVEDEPTLRAAEDMLHSLDGYSNLLAASLQYAETCENIEHLSQTIAELTPIAKQCPELKKTIERLEKEKAEREPLEQWLMARFDKSDAERKAEHAELNKKLAGVPPLVEEARDETVKVSRLSDAIIKQMGGMSDDERTVYFGNADGKTQARLAIELKCSIDHIRYLVKKINKKLQHVGRPKMIWNNRDQKRDRSKPIYEYSQPE